MMDERSDVSIFKEMDMLCTWYNYVVLLDMSAKNGKEQVYFWVFLRKISHRIPLIFLIRFLMNEWVKIHRC